MTLLSSCSQKGGVIVVADTCCIKYGNLLIHQDLYQEIYELLYSTLTGENKYKAVKTTPSASLLFPRRCETSKIDENYCISTNNKCLKCITHTFNKISSDST